jgi:hypothetical protein
MLSAKMVSSQQYSGLIRFRRSRGDHPLVL